MSGGRRTGENPRYSNEFDRGKREKNTCVLTLVCTHATHMCIHTSLMQQSAGEGGGRSKRGDETVTAELIKTTSQKPDGAVAGSTAAVTVSSPRFDRPPQEARFAVLPPQDEVSAHPAIFGGAGTELRPGITCLRSAPSAGLPILYGRGKELGAGEELPLFPSTPPFMASAGEE